nr:hypothetical protein [Vampirovibrio sp.]
KTIVFMTDGYANLPGGDIDINTCYTKYYYGNYYANRGYWSYANYYYDQAQDCTEDYVENLLDMTNFEIARAVNNDVTVHTIQIGGENSNSLNLLRAMLRDEDWDSGLLDTMAFTTDGEQYAAATNDGDGITEIYQTIAKNIKMKLSS